MTTNPMSPDYFSTLSNKWMSITDLRSSLQRVKSLLAQHTALVTRLEGQITTTKESIDASAAYFTAAERLTVVSRAVSAKRKELVATSQPERLRLVNEIDREYHAIMASDLHYQSPVQVLMRSSIGSHRRTLIAGQIADAGPAELLSIAHLAAATNDLEMGAALVTRVSSLPYGKRPFSPHSLAAVLVGATFNEAEMIFGEAEAVITDALAADKTFETGRADAFGKIKAALLRRNNDAKKERLDTAHGVEPEHTDRTLVRLNDIEPTGAEVVGTTLADGSVPETPAGAIARLGG